jgi:selenocysteine lyase/cysteine desulfurase
LGRRASSLLEEARTALADYLRCEADEVVYATNPTTAISLIIRSPPLQPGDEILPRITNMELWIALGISLLKKRELPIVSSPFRCK